MWHAIGFSAHGFQLGPIVGSVIADAIVGTPNEISPIDGLAIGRFGTRAAALTVQGGFVAT